MVLSQEILDEYRRVGQMLSGQSAYVVLKETPSIKVSAQRWDSLPS
jgi:hypothetical protein